MQNAFSGPKLMKDSLPFSAAISPAVFVPWIPKRTIKLETITSFAEIPATSATTICQKPRPTGASSGTSRETSFAPKLAAISEVYPCGPKFKINQIIFLLYAPKRPE